MHGATDAELMSRTRDGDREAFGLLVDRYKDSLVNYLTHLDGRRDRAEEFAQEAFLKLFRAAGRYEALENETVGPLLFRIATNVLRSESRRMSRFKLILLKFAGRDESTSSPQRELLENEIQQQVRRAIESLPLLYRTAVVLRDIEGWSYRDIAETLRCEEGTVKSRICRGREQLKELLDGYWNGDRNDAGRRADGVAACATAKQRLG